ncbi:hypothetical protein N9850_13830, partial [Granulosicoccus sp.]
RAPISSREAISMASRSPGLGDKSNTMVVLSLGSKDRRSQHSNLTSQVIMIAEISHKPTG